jgi:hypothetical protein
MKTAMTAVIVLWFYAGCGAQAQPQTAAPQRMQVAPPAANLDAIVLQIQQATSSASVNIGRLRIEKWKTDSEQKRQLQEISDSLQKNIANAVPGLVNDVQSSRGAVVASFKLYHNVNVVYENLSYLADVAGSLGKKDEFEPLAADAAALDTARQNLSIYIEQAAGRLESANRALANQVKQATEASEAAKKVIVIDEGKSPGKKPAKPTKKKPSGPTSTVPAQPSGTTR